MLASAGERASFLLPRLGLLQLDTAGLQVEAAGTFDPTGRARFALPLGLDAALLSSSLFLQLVSGPPARLGNLDVVVPTKL